MVELGDIGEEWGVEQGGGDEYILGGRLQHEWVFRV